MSVADHEIKLAKMLENIVRNDDVYSLEKFINVHGLPQLHAGALGNACLYGGRDKVRILLDAGASFQILGNYPQHLSVMGDQRYYSLMIVYTDGNDSSQYLPETERVEIAKMLMEYHCKGFIPSRTLLHAILNQCNPIKDFLFASGVRLSTLELTNLADEKKHWYECYDPSYSCAMENMDSKEEQHLNSTMVSNWYELYQLCKKFDQETISPILEDLSVFLKETKVRIYVDKTLLFGRGYWLNNPLHTKSVSILVKYGKMSQNLKNELMNKIIFEQNIELLEVLAEEGWFLNKAKLSKLIEQSLHTEMIASMEWLINYRDHRLEQVKKALKEHGKVDPHLKPKVPRQIPTNMKAENINVSLHTTDETLSEVQSSQYLQLPEGLKNIKQRQFQDRIELISVTFPDSLEVIGNGAFLGCKNLSVIRIGSNLREIHANAFLKTNLKEIKLSKDNTFLSLIDSVLFTNNGKIMILAPSQIGKEYTIPEGVTDLAEGAFNENPQLEKIKFPSTMSTIAAHYMKKCIGLMDITISEGTQYIEEFAFQDCKQIKRIVIPDSVVSIGFPGANIESYQSVNGDFYAFSKLSQYDQVLLLERIILKKSEIPLEQFLNNCTRLTMTARALGLACAFGGIDKVKMLLDKGFDFDWDIKSLKYSSSKSIFIDNYGNFPSRLNFEELSSIDFSLILALPDGYFSELENYIGHTLDEFFEFTINETCQWIPSSERAEIALELLNRKTPFFDPSEVLFYAGLWGNQVVLDVLLHAGIQLSVDSIRVLSHESDLYDLKNKDLRTALLTSDEGFFNTVIKTLHGVMEHTGLQLTIDPSILNHTERLNHPLLFSILTTNPKSKPLLKKYISTMRQHAVIHEQIDILKKMEALGWLKVTTTKDKLIQLAAEKNKYEALSWLLDFKNRTGNLGKESSAFEQNQLDKMSSWDEPDVIIKQNWKYERNPDDTITIMSYIGNKQEITVPDTIDGLAVHSISHRTFSPWLKGINSSQEKQRKKITQIYIPDGITVIGEGAFEDCRKLTEIRLPVTLKKMGGRLFSFCDNLQSITIPKEIDSIEPETFSFCSLSQIDIPDDLKEIGAEAFSFCTSLSNIHLSNGIERIDKYAFRDCRLLTSVNLPSSIKSIGEGAFSNCSTLSEITIPENLSVMESFLFKGCINLKEVYLSNGVETIKDFVFDGCLNLNYIVIPESVLSISPTAFCTGKESSFKQIIPKKLDGIVLKGIRGSYIEQYAIQYNFPFEEIRNS